MKHTTEHAIHRKWPMRGEYENAKRQSFRRDQAKGQPKTAHAGEKANSGGRYELRECGAGGRHQ